MWITTTVIAVQRSNRNNDNAMGLLFLGIFLQAYMPGMQKAVRPPAKNILSINIQTKREETTMKSLFEQFGGTYRKENDYVIPNLEMPDIANFEIGIYGHQYLYFPLQ